MIDIVSLENERKTLYEKYKKENTKGYIFIAIAVLMFILMYALGFPIFLVAGIIFVAVASVFFAKAGKERQAFRNKFKSTLVNKLLAERFTDFTYNPSGQLDINKVNAPAFFKKPDRYSGEDLITGSYKGVKFEVADCTLKERVVRTDSKGNTYVTYETYFQGRYYVYTYERQFKDTLKIVESRWSLSHGLKKFETESIDFNKKFKIFTSDEKHGFYLITPYMIEKLMELEKMHKGTIYYAFIGNKLYIAINDNSNSLEFPIGREINEASVKKFDGDIELIAAIINEFRLDGQKFKN